MRGKIYLLGAILSCVFASALSAESISSSPVFIERIDAPNSEKLKFQVSVVNEGPDPVEIESGFRSVVNYQLGNFDWARENEILILKPNYVILSGQKEVIYYFEHDLKTHPSPDRNKASVRVEVKGFEPVTIDFELKKPGLFSGLKNWLGQGERASEPVADHQSELVANPPSQNISKGNPLAIQPQQQTPPLPSNVETVVEQNLEIPSAQTNPNESAFETTPEPSNPDPQPVVPSAPVGLTVDTTPPVAPSVNSTPQATREASVTLHGGKEGNSSIWINGIEAVAANNQTSWAASVPLTEGANLLRIESHDLAGNISSALTVSVIRDSIPPQIQSMNVSSVNPNSATIEIDVNENVTAKLTYATASGGTNQILQSTVRNSSYTFTLSGLAPETEYSYFIEIEDLTGFQSTSQTSRFTTSSTGSPFQEPIIENVSFHAGGGNFPYSCCRTVGDLNGDGIEDYALFEAILFQPARFIISYSEADGTPGNDPEIHTLSYYTDGYFHYLMPAGDFNRDGYTDVVLGGRSGSYLFHSRMVNGKVKYELAQTIEDKNDDYSIDVMNDFLPYYLDEGPVDFNGDGLKDLLARSTDSWWERRYDEQGNYIGQVIVHSNKHHFIFSDATTGRYHSPVQTAVLDFDIPSDFPEYEVVPFSDLTGDGQPEMMLVLKTNWDAASHKTRFRIYPSPAYAQVQNFDMGEIEGNFWWHAMGDTMSPLDSMAIGDLDGDGIPELLGNIGDFQHSALSQWQYVLIYFDRWAIKKTEMLNLGIISQALRTEDMNQDGIPEVVFLTGLDPNNDDGLVVKIFYSKNGGFDFASAPDVTLDLPGPGRRNAYLFVRKRIFEGETKQDLVLHTTRPDSSLEYMDVIWKQK